MSEILYNDSELQMSSRFILCIEEIDRINMNSPIDTRLFIGWSKKDNEYFVRGKRSDIRQTQFVPFAFQCKSKYDLYEFIEFAVGKEINITFYNFNNIYALPTTDLTYELFEKQMDKNYEVTGYDKVSMTRSKIVKLLKLLKHTYN